jgi:hypothetical protein
VYTDKWVEKQMFQASIIDVTAILYSILWDLIFNTERQINFDDRIPFLLFFISVEIHVSFKLLVHE